MLKMLSIQNNSVLAEPCFAVLIVTIKQVLKNKAKIRKPEKDLNQDKRLHCVSSLEYSCFFFYLLETAPVVAMLLDNKLQTVSFTFADIHSKTGKSLILNGEKSIIIYQNCPSK